MHRTNVSRTITWALLLISPAAFVPTALSQHIRPTMDIPKECAREWKSDYRMQEYCRTQHQKAKASIEGKSIDNRIATHCVTEWSNDWNMFAYCVDKQEQARTWVQSQKLDAEINEHCVSEWPNDWAMLAYCIKEQSKSKARLRD
jgi:hypothetical protein